MAKLYGTKGKTTSATEAEVAVFKAEAALEGALARSDDPETDSEVRAARIRLAGAQAALDQFDKKFKLLGIVLVILGVGLAVLVVAMPPEEGFRLFDFTLIFTGLVVAFVGWRVATWRTDW